MTLFVSVVSLTSLLSTKPYSLSLIEGHRLIADVEDTSRRLVPFWSSPVRCCRWTDCASLPTRREGMRRDRWWYRWQLPIWNVCVISFWSVSLGELSVGGYEWNNSRKCVNFYLIHLKTYISLRFISQMNHLGSYYRRIKTNPDQRITRCRYVQS